MRSFDYIIIGAGAAGCLLANRLTAEPTRRVLLVEAGPRKDTLAVRMPAAFPNLFHTERDWDYYTTPQQHLNGRRIYIPRGRMLGGSTSMNAMIYQRCAREDFDGWSGADGPWAYDVVRPYFERIESEGELSIQPPTYTNPLTERFLEAASACGLPARDVITAEDMVGVAKTRVTQCNGRRCSGARAYIEPALRRANLTIVSDAMVTKINFDGNTATGIQVQTNAGTEDIAAAREVIVAAGAFNSPQLLMLSGLGPADHLASYSIETRFDIPGVGQNYQDHLLIGGRFWSKAPSSLANAGTLPNLLRFSVLRRGPLTSNIAEAYAFTKTTSDLSVPDLELVFAPAIYDTDQPHAKHGFSIGIVPLQPRSAGAVRRVSANPSEPPVIDANFFADPADEQVVRIGLDLAHRIAEAPPLAEVNGGLIPWNGAPDMGQDPVGFARALAETIYHPVGTCRMGQDELAVVDYELRVRGLERLRVVDASVIPRVPRGHPQGAIFMLAERAAEMILQAA